MKTAIIIDSTAYVREEILNSPDVYELQFTSTFKDGTNYTDNSDAESLAKFYRKLEGASTLPKTSQPSLGEYIELVEEIIEKDYDQLLCIHLSAGLSGAYQTAQMIAEDYKRAIQIQVIDSKGASVVIEALIIQALEMLEKNLSFEAICEQLIWVANHSMIYLTVSDLDNLVKGGRLNRGAAKIGELLNIQPLLCIGQDGRIQLIERIRTDKRMNRRLAQIAKKSMADYPNGVMLGFAHAMNEQRLKSVIGIVTKDQPDQSYLKGALGPVIGTHTGSGAIGMGVIPIASY
ncbi:MAG: DegV family protein [Atopostipes sp.]|nr:DegV family protein [Atopostipes sp.]